MYDAASQDRLAERTDAETWLLRELLVALEYTRDSETPRIIKIDDDHSRHFVLAAGTGHFGSNRVQTLGKSLAAAVFSTSFKVIDQVIEWCLEENVSINNRITFAAKAKMARRGDISTWPPSLIRQPIITQVIIETFACCRFKRNKMIHGCWGSSDDGKLKFNFTYVDDLNPTHPALLDSDVIDFEEVKHFAAFARTLSDMLLGKCRPQIVAQRILRSLANGFPTLHKASIPSEPSFGYFHVVRETSDNLIDIRAIRAVVAKQSPNYLFDLEINSGDSKWFLPCDMTESLGETLTIDSALDQYRA